MNFRKIYEFWIIFEFWKIGFRKQFARKSLRFIYKILSSRLYSTLFLTRELSSRVIKIPNDFTENLCFCHFARNNLRFVYKISFSKERAPLFFSIGEVSSAVSFVFKNGFVSWNTSVLETWFSQAVAPKFLSQRAKRTFLLDQGIFFSSWLNYFWFVRICFSFGKCFGQAVGKLEISLQNFFLQERTALFFCVRLKLRKL